MFIYMIYGFIVGIVATECVIKESTYMLSIEIASHDNIFNNNWRQLC